MMFNPYYQNYNFQNNYPNFQNNYPQYITKQVSNIEEAKNSIVDALSTYLFIDYNNNKIYLKRMNNNGTSDFYSFSMDNVQRKDPLNEINNRLINIENLIGKKNELQSVSYDTKSKSPVISESAGNDERKK